MCRDSPFKKTLSLFLQGFERVTRDWRVMEFCKSSKCIIDSERLGYREFSYESHCCNAV